MLNCNESSWRNGVEMPRNKHKVSSKEGPFVNYCTCRTCHGDLYLAIDVVAGKVYGACKDCKIVTDLEDPGPVMEERINRGEHK